MKQSTPASAGISETEFSIYVYHYPEDIEARHTDWEKVAVTNCIQEAVNKAQSLYDSREFKKVEIKKKYFDPKYQRVIDATYKVLQDRKKRVSRRSGIMALFGFSCFAGLTVIALPFIGLF